ncbi:hypothetical protein [Pseudomonas kitaguniensis]|uniref:hypothetical protein n=1 Tax=Pseudomonas kitaguniensis TaxID=2607908 RepID=UPI003CFDED60
MSDTQEIPAFPTGDHPESRLYANPGMSLRDYFAAKAIVKIAPSFGEIGELATAGHGVEEILQLAAKYSYEIADHMLAARSA